MKSLVDQDNLMRKIDEWKAAEDVNIFFRPYVDPESSSDYVCVTDTEGNVTIHGGGGLFTRRPGSVVCCVATAPSA